MADEKSFDVFLSHCSDDKPAVELLARRLEDNAGLRPFLDKWHLVPGEPWQEELEHALMRSRTCAVFIGSSGIGPWHNEEMRGALQLRAEQYDFRVIPVLLVGSTLPSSNKLPLFLRRLTWVDFRSGLDDPYEFHRLICGIRGITPGRVREPQGSNPPGISLKLDNPFYIAGAMPPSTRSYVERQCDTELRNLIKLAPLIVIHGDYEVGKSSLFIRLSSRTDIDWKIFYKDLTGMRVDDERLFMRDFFKMLSSIFGHIDTWDRLKEQLPNNRTIFLLDEFGALTSPVASALVNAFHWLFEQVPSHFKLIVALPVSFTHFLQTCEIRNPKYERPWVSIRILPLNESEVKTLLNLLPEPATTLAKQHLRTIMGFSLGYPRKIQCLCSALFDLAVAGRSKGELYNAIHNRENYS